MSGKLKRILLGFISGAHGIRGDVILRSFAQDPAAVGDYGVLTSKDGSRSFEIKVRRVTNKGVVAGIKGVTDRNSAEALKGTELYVLREQLNEPEEGEFFYSDLIGLSAVDLKGNAVGKVVGVDNFGAGDLLEVRLKGKKQTEYISFTHDFVPDVDLEARRVVIVLPPEDEEDHEGKPD